MDQICSYCGAFYWLREKNTHGIYQKCCHSGKVVLPAMPPPPPYVKSLLLRQGNDGVIFSKRPKTYNGWLSFASISLSAFPFTRGVPAMRIQGQIYHNLGPINPPEGVQPRNMQVLFRTSGWTYDIKYHGGLVDNCKNVSVMRFYAYRAQVHYSNMLYTYKKYNVLYLHPYL